MPTPLHNQSKHPWKPMQKCTLWVEYQGLPICVSHMPFAEQSSRDHRSPTQLINCVMSDVWGGREWMCLLVSAEPGDLQINVNLVTVHKYDHRLLHNTPCKVIHCLPTHRRALYCHLVIHQSTLGQHSHPLLSLQKYAWMVSCHLQHWLHRG